MNTMAALLLSVDERASSKSLLCTQISTFRTKPTAPGLGQVVLVGGALGWVLEYTHSTQAL